jgi:acyl-CoA thioesterase-1
MRNGGLVVVATALLGACNGDATAPQAGETAAASASQAGAIAPSAIVEPELRILALGDSLFAGYGLQRGQGYPERLEAALRERGINARVSNAGVSGDTSAAGLQRLGFVLENEAAVPDLALVELGANDMLRGIPPQQTRANLEAILKQLDERGIPVVLMGMRAPPNLGSGYVAQFDAIYRELAEQHGAALVPFLIESVWSRPELIQQDRLHPTAQGIEALVAETVDGVVEALPDEGAE